jgi:fucose permease
MNFTKHETSVYPDVFITVLQVLSDDAQASGPLLIMNVCLAVFITVLQVLSDEGQASGSLLIMNVCPALVQHLTSLSHI